MKKIISTLLTLTLMLTMLISFTSGLNPYDNLIEAQENWSLNPGLGKSEFNTDGYLELQGNTADPGTAAYSFEKFQDKEFIIKFQASSIEGVIGFVFRNKSATSNGTEMVPWAGGTPLAINFAPAHGVAGIGEYVTSNEATYVPTDAPFAPFSLDPLETYTLNIKTVDVASGVQVKVKLNGNDYLDAIIEKEELKGEGYMGVWTYSINDNLIVKSIEVLDIQEYVAPEISDNRNVLLGQEKWNLFAGSGKSEFTQDGNLYLEGDESSGAGATYAGKKLFEEEITIQFVADVGLVSGFVFRNKSTINNGSEMIPWAGGKPLAINIGANAIQLAEYVSAVAATEVDSKAINLNDGNIHTLIVKITDTENGVNVYATIDGEDLFDTEILITELKGEGSFGVWAYTADDKLLLDAIQIEGVELENEESSSEESSIEESSIEESSMEESSMEESSIEESSSAVNSSEVASSGDLESDLNESAGDYSKVSMLIVMITLSFISILLLKRKRFN